MSCRAKLSVLAVAVLTVAWASPCHAQLTVFDPANYQQNLLSALRALDAVNNQVRQLQNEAQMLLRMDRHLQGLPGSISPQLSQVLSQMQRQLSSGDAIALKVQETDTAFARLFPNTFADTLTSDDIVRQSGARWDETHAAFKRAALLQGQITESTTADSRLLTDILSRSEGSVGALQAARPATSSPPSTSSKLSSCKLSSPLKPAPKPSIARALSSPNRKPANCSNPS
jgi:P-type conjugative transfer protein TrbJ